MHHVTDATSTPPRPVLQLVQETRGMWHVCGAYVDGEFRCGWDRHPDEGDALAALRTLAADMTVAPMLFVPRKFEDWHMGRHECDRLNHDRQGIACSCDGVWPRSLSSLREHIIPRTWDFPVPYDAMVSTVPAC